MSLGMRRPECVCVRTGNVCQLKGDESALSNASAESWAERDIFLLHTSDDRMNDHTAGRSRYGICKKKNREHERILMPTISRYEIHF